MRRFVCFFLDMIIAAALLIWLHHWYENLQYQPTKNKHPQQFFTIKGYVAPSLRKEVKLKWQALYQTSTKRCIKVYSIDYEGPRDTTVNFRPMFKSNSTFSLRVPYDYFKADECNWQLVAISDKTHVNNKPWFISMVTFDDSTVSSSHDRYQTTAHYHIICNSKRCSVQKNSQYFNESGQDVPRDPRLTFIDTFTVKKTS